MSSSYLCISAVGSGPCSRSVEEIVNGDSTCVVKRSVDEDENCVPVPIQFGYCRFPSCCRTTYHNCIGVPKKLKLKLDIWSRSYNKPLDDETSLTHCSEFRIRIYNRLNTQKKNNFYIKRQKKLYINRLSILLLTKCFVRNIHCFNF